MRGTPEQRFIAKVRRTRGCWLWTGKANAVVPPLFRVGGKDGRRTQIQRYAHELWIGPIPDGHQVMRTCRNALCVKPAHLKAYASNLAALKDGFYEKTERWQRDMLRQAYLDSYHDKDGDSVLALARRFGLSKNTAYYIARGQTHEHEVTEWPEIRIGTTRRQRDAIREVYDSGGNVSAIARSLGVNRYTAGRIARRELWPNEETA